MNARLRAVRSHMPPVRNPSTPAPAEKALRLQPVAWGKRDADLARAVCRHLVEVTPPIVIPLNPLSHARVRAWLRTHGIHH